jgi:hypothetical protein
MAARARPQRHFGDAVERGARRRGGAHRTGRLTSRGHNQALAQALARAARRVGASEDALALAAVLARPWVDAVLSGASTVAQLESNLAGPRVPWDEPLEAAGGARRGLGQLLEDAAEPAVDVIPGARYSNPRSRAQSTVRRRVSPALVYSRPSSRVARLPS